MNRKWIIGILSSAVMLTVACDNELELVAEYKNIPITYGLLSRSDTAQYIRVEKAFVDPRKSALLLAQEPDSLYYENLLVELENLNNAQVYTLDRVDGNLDGYPRDSGIFATSPNWLYKIKTEDMRLQGGDRIRIRINRGEPFEEITATTTVIGDITLIRPRDGSTVDFTGFGDFSVVWVADPAASFYDVTVHLFVSEWEAGSTDPRRVVDIPWGIGESLTESRVNISKREFFSVLANRLDRQENLVRSLDSIRLDIFAGGEALYDFIQVSLANTGITASQDIPRVTNMSEGFGVFSSRTYLGESDFEISRTTRDSLRENALTRDLNFL
jgi:hypothetical protein